MVEKFTLRIRKLLNTYQQNDCWWYLTCRMNKAKTTFAWTRIGQLLWAKSNSTTTCIPKALLKMSTSTWDDYVDCIVRLDEPVRANFHPSSDISAWTFHQSSQIPNILGRIDGRTCPYRFQEIQMQSLYSKSSLLWNHQPSMKPFPQKARFQFFHFEMFFFRYPLPMDPNHFNITNFSRQDTRWWALQPVTRAMGFTNWTPKWWSWVI